MVCKRCDSDPGPTLFCQHCGLAPDKQAVRSVRFGGFTGRASTNPKMEQFWATGDPSVFDPSPSA
jgi:hypothetical protein